MTSTDFMLNKMKSDSSKQADLSEPTKQCIPEDESDNHQITKNTPPQHIPSPTMMDILTQCMNANKKLENQPK